MKRTGDGQTMADDNFNSEFVSWVDDCLRNTAEAVASSVEFQLPQSMPVKSRSDRPRTSIIRARLLLSFLTALLLLVGIMVLVSLPAPRSSHSVAVPDQSINHDFQRRATFSTVSTSTTALPTTSTIGSSIPFGGVEPNGAIDFVDQSVGYMLTDANSGTPAIVDKTTDAGMTWTTVLDSNEELSGIDFANSYDGWAVGHGILLATTNAGESWSSMGETSPELVNVDFATASDGWAINQSGSLFATTNGGSSWTTLQAPEPSGDECLAGSTSDGWIVGLEGVEATIDGGETWTKQYTPSSSFWSATPPELSCASQSALLTINTQGGASSYSYLVAVGSGSPSDTTWTTYPLSYGGQPGSNETAQSLMYQGQIVQGASTGNGPVILSVCEGQCSAPVFVSGQTSSGSSFWQTSLSPEGLTSGNGALTFINSADGWAAIQTDSSGNWGQEVFSTQDGGATWSFDASVPQSG